MEKNSNEKKNKKVGGKRLEVIITEPSEISQKREKELQEMDRIAKGLIKRDLELSEIREKREKEFQELEEKTKELEKSRKALTNILEDVEGTRGKAEEERNKTLAIINNFADGLLVFDKENKLLLANPQAETFLKIKTDEITGKSFSELTQYSNFKPFIDLLGREIKGIFRKELSIKENLILETSTVSMISGEEKLGTLVILHDVTREKTIEKLKTEFVSLAAHQLRTPLSAIKWTLRMILSGDLGEINQEQKEFIEKADINNERMIVLINDLLNVTRIEEGRYVFKLVPCQYGEILDSAINNLKEKIAHRKVKLELKTPDKKDLLINVDKEKMIMVIQNLIENAINFSPPGSTVKVMLSFDESDMTFSVKDFGIGMPVNQQSRIFTKFFRGSNAMKIDVGGTGLGLFIAKNIIEGHGGKIWFESEENKGATFYFTLPVSKQTPHKDLQP